MVWAVDQQMNSGGSAQNLSVSKCLQNPRLISLFLYLKLLENMFTLTVPSTSMDINGEKCTLVGFLSKVPVIQRQA